MKYPLTLLASLCAIGLFVAIVHGVVTTAREQESKSSHESSSLVPAPQVLVEAIERYTGKECPGAYLDTAESTATDMRVICQRQSGSWTGLGDYHIKITGSGYYITRE